ncbi:putative transmembrane protein [Mycobacterium tuberculosis variant bovis BCG str. ATCC 35743]|nr:putative transmembrane protein [Mycobacterium tuberculosis variant bovis BCG str. ATCC 35743]
MSGIASAALILSLALVVLPGSPRCRLTPDDTGRRVLLVGARRVAWGVGCVAVGVAALLPLPTVVAVAVLGATLGLRYRRRRRYLRRSREGQALEAALELVVGELRAGAHPVRAFSIAADETGGPVAVALRAVAARARLGADVTAGLLAAARSSALPAYWERLAVCWQLGSDHGLAIASLMRAAQRDVAERQRFSARGSAGSDHGLAIASLMRAAQRDVAERQRFSARVSAGMAGARASAAILAILPLLGVLLGQLIGARPLSFLLTGRVGGWLLVVGLTLACAGLLWSDRITDRPVL